jgi:hypothetical protein
MSPVPLYTEIFSAALPKKSAHLFTAWIELNPAEGPIFQVFPEICATYFVFIFSPPVGDTDETIESGERLATKFGEVR